MELSVEDGRVRLAYTVTFGPMRALLLRREMDVDGDHAVGRAEAAAWAKRWQRDAVAKWSFTLDGADAEVTYDEPALDGATGRLRPEPVVMTMAARIRVRGGGVRTLVLVDALAPSAVHTSRYRVAAASPAKLLAAGPTQNPRSLETVTMFVEPADEAVTRTFAVRFRTPQPPPVAVALAAFAAVGVVFGRLVWKRRRRARQRMMKG